MILIPPASQRVTILITESYGHFGAFRRDIPARVTDTGQVSKSPGQRETIMATWMSSLGKITNQRDLNKIIEELREEGYPYLGSDDARHVLLPDGSVLWTAPDPFDEDAEDWTSVQTLDEFADSVFCWYHDC
jgi:hypothetical protein